MMTDSRKTTFILIMIFGNIYCRDIYFTESKQGTSVAKLSTAVNQFGVDLYKRLASRGNEQVFFSPFSLSTALTMAYLGAKGETAAEMRGTLGFLKAGLEVEEVSRSFYEAFELLGNGQRDYQLDLADMALIQNNYRVLDDYKRTLEGNLHADIKLVDFVYDGLGVKDSVNSWVSSKTHNKITSLLSKPLDSLTRLFLLNAVYFKGMWITQFDRKKTVHLPFFNQKRLSKSVPMMKVTSKFPYSYDNNLKYKVLELPYKGDRISMVIILPEKEYGLKNVESSLTSDSLNRLVNSLQVRKVDVTLPKFKLEDSPMVKQYLQDMGIKKAFSTAADFSGISGRQDLYVEDVLHKAVIEVNEEGSEAAAVTGVVISLKSASAHEEHIEIFNADHPFLFFIRDKVSGIILFMGSVNDL
ncbi:leukocyte elastase inhibitor-like [Limulus polyphemus]|uniref:Leukocyte elastase inhibitor-like n=1 Tax=Limulus polyphemus TaxID=6850 RepID=A0ABM1BY85_LIMPO|nr:leukocyte elastase inhibitor-like [Limulus polyphemus]